jgi:hypothetical protein
MIYQTASEIRDALAQHGLIANILYGGIPEKNSVRKQGMQVNSILLSCYDDV